MTDQIKSGGEHWSRQGIVARIIRAMVEANGKVQAVPAGKAADDILALLAPALSRTPAKAGEDGVDDKVKALVEAARPFNLALRDHVPDEQIIEWVGFTAGDYRALARAVAALHGDQEG